MAPLFKPAQPVLLRDRQDYQDHQDQPKAIPSSQLDETKSISELLDEISRSPPSDRSPSPVSDQGSPFRAHKPRLNPQGSTRTAAIINTSNSFGFDAIDITPTPAPVQYGDEMDWSPTQSRHRAFNTVGQRQTAGFNESPVSPDRGPFWYRVPPAPTSPAQRATAGMVSQPWLRRGTTIQQQQHQAEASPFASGSHGMTGDMGADIGSIDEGDRGTKTRYRGVNFREARFFPPANQEDPRNSLLDMFGQTLSLSEEEVERRKRESAMSTGTNPGSSWLGRSWKGFMSGESQAGNGFAPQ